MGTKFLFEQIYFKSTGYSFNNLGRLFLRLFFGLMMVQFGLRQLIGSDTGLSQFAIPYLASDLKMWLVIIVEIICPFCVMIGFFTRVLILPPLILMIISAHHIFVEFGTTGIDSVQLLSIPFLFMGIIGYLLLCGPGKISVDYFLSLYLINRNNGKEEDLEEV